MILACNAARKNESHGAVALLTGARGVRRMSRLSELHTHAHTHARITQIKESAASQKSIFKTTTAAAAAAAAAAATPNIQSSIKTIIVELTCWRRHYAVLAIGHDSPPHACPVTSLLRADVRKEHFGHGLLVPSYSCPSLPVNVTVIRYGMRGVVIVMSHSGES